MDIETMPHAMYFTGNTDTVTKINHVQYQTIAYNENGMFTTKLMNDTPVEIFIDNGATPSILPLHTYNKFPILHIYPKTERNTQEEVVSLTLQPKKTSFTPRHTITGKGIAYVKPFDTTLPLRPIEIEFENNRCCIEVHNTSNSTVEFLYRQEIAYFDARSKGLVQTNNSKHLPIDQYLHDRIIPATLSPTPLAYEKPIHPTEMPHITTCTELSVDNTNKPTQDDKYPWLESDDIKRNMTDSEILRMKLNLKDSMLDEKGKEEFLKNVEQFTNIFSLRDEIGTCPFIEVHLKLKDETPFFVRKTIPNERRTKESQTKRNGQTRAFRHYSERTDRLQLTSCLSKMEKSKFVPSLQ